MPDLLLYGDTIRNPALRHEVPIAIMDPFLYAEVGGRPHVLTSPLERERLEKALPGAEFVDGRELGFLELLETGITRDQIDIELASRMAAELGLREAIVDFAFPLGLGERLRADGIELTVDDEAVK